MKLVGFNFKKIQIEKFSDSLKNLKFNTKININDILRIDSKLFKEKEELIKVNFTYNIDYNPDIAKIELEGNLIIAAEKTLSKGIIEGWKERKMSEDFRVILFNLILKKSSVKALELEEQMNLPLHIPLPTLKKQEKNKD